MSVHLTPRQKEVTRLISLGCSVHDIAGILKLSTSTVDNHRHAAMLALGTNKATLLTRLALKHKVTSMNDKLTTAEKRRRGKKNRGKKSDGWN